MAEEDQKPDESGKPDETEGTDESVLDPEEQELRDALKAQEESENQGKTGGEEESGETAGKTSDTGEPPEKEGEKEETPSVPVDVVHALRAKNRELREQLAYLSGQLDAREKSEGKEETPDQPATPQERLNSLRDELKEWSQKFDDGDITAAELGQKQQEILDQQLEIREQMLLERVQQMSTQAPQNDLALEQHLDQLTEQYPVIQELTSEQLEPFKAIVMQKAAAEGNPIEPGPKGTMRLREGIAKLAQEIYGGKTEPGNKPATASKDPLDVVRENKLKQAKEHPVDVSQMGHGETSTGITEEEALARINQMTTEEEIEEFLQKNPSLVNRIMGAV